jgi:hypothetical protein
MYSYKDDRTEREKQLEWELERERDEQRERDRIEDERREANRREREEMWRYDERHADSWPEAFQKQARLCWREHNAFPEQNEEDDYFEKTAQANEKALELWREVSASKKSKIDELQKQIEAVQDEIRNEVADKLEAISNHYSYTGTAQQIRDDDLDRYLDW